MALLGVNIDHVATLRQARGTSYPDPLQAAWEAELGGADGITVHLREDRRHIQLQDVQILKERIHTRLNLEMAATPEMVKIACQIKPAFCCLVPEGRHELTTEGGLDVVQHSPLIRSVSETLHAAGIQVSLFIAADARQLDAARACGVSLVEIHTGEYADARDLAAQQVEREKIRQAIAHAQQLGLTVNVGHGLHYHNVQAIVAIPGIHECNIGHAIVARAVFCGMRKAVRSMKRLVK